MPKDQTKDQSEDNPTPTPALAAAIQSYIDALRPTTLGEWPLRVCKEELNALPLHGGNLYIWAMRPDGEVLCLDLDSVAHTTVPETDPLTRFAVIVHGAATYPALRALVPRPPTNTAACLDCHAKGFRTDAFLGDQPCARCNGLGWIAEATSSR